MKFYKLTGFFACALLIVSCFLPWAYYADLHESFTGFYSHENIYGKPAKVFIFLAVCSLILIYLDKIWAKRTLIFLSALNIGYLIKTYVLFTSCYSTICPQKQYGLYLLMISVLALLIVSLLPNLKVEEETPKEK